MYKAIVPCQKYEVNLQILKGVDPRLRGVSDREGE